MSDTIKYISKVEIKGLWGKYDLEWNLQPDVNVLSGINGSGKSTILNCIYELINNTTFVNYELLDQLGKLRILTCKIRFNNGHDVIFEFIKKDGFKDPKEERASEFRLQRIHKENIKATSDAYHRYGFVGAHFTVFVNVNLSLIKLKEFFQIDFISTFDNELKSSDKINKIPDEFVKTELDWQIYHLNNRYIEYKLDVANKINDAISKNETNGELIKIQANQNRFLDILDTLFTQTGKKVNRKENKISFLTGEEKISTHQLSSGEKQLLVILLTVLVQDNKNAIFFMDEPEISLHFDWQKDLIEYMRELNPNVQIILATHSPAMIMNGWMDKVSDVSDLIKPAQNN